MKRTSSLWILAAVACLPLAACGGCGDKGNGGGSSGASTSTAALSASATPVASASGMSSAARRMAMMVRASGAVGALFRAASQADLSEDQKAKIEKIASDMREADKTDSADGGGPRKEMKNLHDELVAGIKAGKVDNAKLEPHYGKLEADAKERSVRELDALGKLHGVLDAEQRKKLGEQVKKQEEDRNERAKKAEAAQATRDAGAHFSPQRRRFERYGKDLDLDADQKKKLDGIIPTDDPKLVANLRDDAKKRADATVDAFMKDSWDAKGIPSPEMKTLRRPIDDQVKFFNALIPTLKPEQKEKLVAVVEKQGGGMGGPGADDHGRRRPMGFPPGMGGDRPHAPEEDGKEDDNH